MELTEKMTPPKNRCIIVGSAIEENFKIFINYLTIAKSMKHGLKDTIHEQGGLLVGNIHVDKRIDEHFTYVDIKSIMPVHRVGAQKKFTFSEEEMEKLEKEVREKFPDNRIVGWYHSHPGWGIELSDDDQDTHMSFFNENWHVLLLVESVAKDFSIFSTNGELQKAVLSKGYVIYCDSNDDIPKMKKLFDMVEQNRERKKGKQNKIIEKQQELNEEDKSDTDDQEIYLSFLHPKVVITVLSSIIVLLIIVIVLGIINIKELKNQANYKNDNFSIETSAPDANSKEIFMKSDFMDENLKIIANPREGGVNKWKISEIYIKKGGSPYQLVARMEVPTPPEVIQDVTPNGTGTPVLSNTPEVLETPVVSPSPGSVNERNDTLIKQKVMDWVESWKKGEVDKFKSFYSSSFKNSKTGSLDTWINQKVSDKVFEGKPQVDIVGDITLNYIDDNKVDVKFEQYFNGKFVSSGYKTLTFTKENGDWLISGEEFEYK